MKTTPTTRVRFVLVIGLILVSAALAGCTRDRPTPETVTSTTTVVSTVIALPAELPVDSSGAETTDAGGEPEAISVETPVPGEGDPAAAGEPETVIEEYEVKSGDTVGSIAIEFGMSVEDLRALNLMEDDLIQVGQRLQVRITPPTPTPTPAPFLHIVARGETLSEIAAKYGVSWVDIIAINRMPDQNALRAGQELIIPGYSPEAPVVEGEETAPAEGEVAASGEPATTELSADGSAQATHVVKANETLIQIAEIYGLNVGTLATANNIRNRSLLRTGQVLVLPGVTQNQADAARAIKHTVQRGESLSQIAKDYGVATSAIVRANNLANPNSVYTGQVLIIPQPE
jgi:LysM repeat protein